MGKFVNATLAAWAQIATKLRMRETVKQLPTRDGARMWHSSRLVQVLGHILLYARLQSKACNLQGHLGQDEVPMTEESQTQEGTQG